MRIFWVTSYCSSWHRSLRRNTCTAGMYRSYFIATILFRTFDNKMPEQVRYNSKLLLVRAIDEKHQLRRNLWTLLFLKGFIISEFI